MSLLAMAQRTIEQMDPTTAAQYADVCFTFLLKALDLRQKRPAHLPGLDTVEQGGVAVLLALTMKLSEAKFKPLFLRLLAWATTPPTAQPGGYITMVPIPDFCLMRFRRKSVGTIDTAGSSVTHWQLSN